MTEMRERVRARLLGARKRRLTIAIAVIGSLASLAMAAPAMANLKQDLKRFEQCPVNAPEVSTCVYSRTTSGEFVLGSGTVPIDKTVVIQGGLAGGKLVPALNGETLSKTPLTVPGGLVGIALPGDFSEVTATAELAGQGEIGFGVVLPLKTKLDNLLLGGNCYIGTDEEPLVLNLIYGTTNPPPPNAPISGKAVITSQDGYITTITGTLVDNSFAAPGATGCTALPLVGDAAVNAKEGLPAAAGKNTAIMNGVTEEVASSVVKAGLALPELGRCEKAPGVPEGKKIVPNGNYYTAACTAESPSKVGKYEWTPGPGPNPKFSGLGGVTKLETVGKSLVTCTASSSAGEYTGTKTASMSLTFTGCASGVKGSGPACQSSGAGAGEIQTASLDGELEFIEEKETPEKPVVGIDLKPASGPNLASFECGGSSVAVSGSVIMPITAVDKMSSSFKLKAKATGGLQAPEAFEAGVKDTLTFTPSPGSPEQAGLTGSSTITNEEKLAIKALI